MAKSPPFALVYDFDGTLAPGNMQERDFIPAVGMTGEAFWNEVTEESTKHEADNTLIYMKLMLEKAEASKVPVKKENFRRYGQGLRFFDGVTSYKSGSRRISGWFDRINAYGKARRLDVQHYIISSGIREMVAGSPIAGHFHRIFASSFCYDHNGIARWPALAVNYTNKTQFLFRINKGALSVHDHKTINAHIPKEARAVPFEQMVFIGDGDTDIPCFRLITDQQGYAVAVYRPRTPGARRAAAKLLEEGRVGFTAAADYREGKPLDRLVKGIIDRIAAEQHLRTLGGR